ncbi:MAG: serine/threonine protein kinase [Candidatus Melainabacteria bacterium]|nr:serine/threonine protein kinase [Candidatus Melainabacteria bacterium]
MPLLHAGHEEFQAVDPFIGTTIDGKYQVMENVGQGGMSIVYKAMQTAMNRVVALKMLKMGLSSDPIFAQRFMREASLLGKLNHPNIVTVFDSGMTQQGNLYLAMDFLCGPTLQDILDKSGAIPIERAAALILQICDALNHAHKRDIIHRDLKPGNIMIETDHRGVEVVKIVDFGLAKMGEGSERLTRAGELWGSSFYMSPEQCNGTESDSRSDIYSFGIVMYQMLTGKVPFRGSGFMETVGKQLSEPPPPLRATKADLVLPDMTERVLFKCLEKAPENRFQNVADLKSALQSVLPEPAKLEKELSSRPARPVAAPRPAPKKEKAKPKDASEGANMKGLIVLFVVLIVCCIAVFFVLTNHKPEQAPNKVAPAGSAPITKESIGVSSGKKTVYSDSGKVEQSKTSPASAAPGKTPTTVTTPAAAGSSPATGANSSAAQGQKNSASVPVVKKKPRRNLEQYVEVPAGSGQRKRDAQDMINRN